MFKNEWLSRQNELISGDVLDKQIFFICCGAIGSFATLMLAKIGFHNITVIDFDTVEIANIGPQFFRFSDIGKPKAIALKDLVKDFTNIDITTKNEKYEKGIFPGIVCK